MKANFICRDFAAPGDVQTIDGEVPGNVAPATYQLSAGAPATLRKFQLHGVVEPHVAVYIEIPREPRVSW